MIGFTTKYLLLIVSIIIAYCLIWFIPGPYLLLIAIVPSIIYSLYVKRIILFIIIFAFLIIIFIIGYISLNATEMNDFIAFIQYLFVIIYPFKNGITKIELFSNPIFLTIVILFICFVMVIAVLIKFSPFKTMISFSYVLLGITSIYIIINMIGYLIPAFKDFFTYNIYMQYISLFLYAILPFLVISLLIFYILTLFDFRYRSSYNKDVKQLKTIKRGALLWKIISVVIIIIVIVICVLYVVIMI